MKKRTSKVLSVMLILTLIFALTLQAYAVDSTTAATPWDGKTTPGWTPAKSTTIVTSTTGTYVVKSGDFIWKIANAHGITVAQLMAMNPTVKDANLIRVGQRLIVKTTAPAAPVTPAKEPGIYPDVVASASVNLTTETQLQKSLGEKGTWITTLGGNATLTKDLTWIGDIRKEGAKAPARKLGIYYHSSPNIGGEQVFSLKLPNLIVKAENANLAYGTLDGNVKVEANGFKLTYCTITGQLEFATQAQYDSATFNEVVIKGDVLVAGQKLASNMKPQTLTRYGKYSEASTSGDMMKVAVTFKDAKAHDVTIDVMGPSYFLKSGILSSGGQGNWGKISYSKAGQYTMVKPTDDRPADSILTWDKQMTTLIAEYKKANYDLSKFPTIKRDATHPSVLNFNKILDGKYSAYTVSAMNGALDSTKLKGAERSAAAKADAITSCSVDVGKYLKLVDSIVKEGVK
jgi:LysM repeat protein